MEITDLLVYAKQHNASDLHLSSGSPPIVRVNGEMIPTNENVRLDADMVKAMIYSIMTEQQRTDYEQHFETDFSIAFGDQMRFRVNAFNTINGPAAVFRTIPIDILSLETLKAPPIFAQLTKLHKGLVLVTGPTGSGKSTTLAAMIDHINTTQAKHIITIEDPIEFVHQTKKSLVNQREIGSSTKSFSQALKSCLREDPDVILVGEMRDLETIQLALTAAETGHLVMGTLHTNTAPKTIDRIIDVFPASDKSMVRAMLSVSLQAIIAQTLVRNTSGGRVAAHEIMIGTPPVRNLVREGKVPQLYSMIQMGKKHGMLTMKDSLDNLVNEGIITAETMHEALSSLEDNDEDATTEKQTSDNASNQQEAPKKHSITIGNNNAF